MSDHRWRRIEELYHAALGLLPEQRTAFLEDASGGDSELLREVESLLAQHDSQDSVFDQPAWRDLGPNGQPASLTETLLGDGAVLGPYRITGLLGAGGMGQVYRAHDSRLNRSVAIKVFFPGQDARRFEREARAVAALSHPNVVPIFDLGHESGVDYLVEELVEGESLRDLLGRGPLDVARCWHLAAQIADGLAAAHRAGIIHRDLKPGNIMISREECARILDFGLATSQRSGSDATAASLPHSIIVAGTAAYMSPEQIRGDRIDTRSDIFSYGAVLYEMITGRRAFGRDTVTATLAAVLQDDPPPVGEIAAGVPRKLEQIVHKCLSKDPGHRFQAIHDVTPALADAARPQPGRHAAVASVAAAVVLGLGLAGWLFYSRKTPAPTNRDTVVLADFANSTGDPAFDVALKQGLAVQLGQSPLLNILPEQKVRSALKEMAHRPDEALTATVAQQTCQHTGSKAYIAGSITYQGGHYVIGLNAVNCTTGDALREQTEAGNKQEVLAALGLAVVSLRNRLGSMLREPASTNVHVGSQPNENPSGAAVSRPVLPPPGGYVADMVGVIDPESKRWLDAYSAGLARRYGAELGILVVDSLQGESVEHFATRTFKSWGLGRKNKNDGLLLLLAIKDHRSRLEVGYGVEYLFTPETCARILADMQPSLRGKEYGKALRDAGLTIGSIFNGAQLK
jgi:predicted Ser/Thr protein kinase